MKKILTVLLSAAMVVAAPASIFADEFQQIENNVNEGTILLEASKASSYTVKLPTKVNVSNDSTTFNIYAKGDVDGSKMVVVEAQAGDHYIKDDAKLKADKKLTITAGDGIKGEFIGEDYDLEKGTTMTLVHDPIEAGSWNGELPILIKLSPVQAQ